MTAHRLERVQMISRPRSEVFRFFSDARNLEKITPGFLRLRVLTPMPIDMMPGTELEYRIRLYGYPVHWRTLIEVFQPDERFVDVQINGPYRSWRHLHEFTEAQGGTEMRDTVEYELPLGPLGELARRLFVRRSLERIFDYRRDVIAEVFGPEKNRAARAPKLIG